MWPWEHAAVGYLLFSPLVHGLARREPTGPAAILVLVATQVPDLVDKSLAWGLGLFPSGFAIAHSALLVIPAGILVVSLTWRTDRQEYGLALVVGYWSHLVADVVDPLRYGAEIRVDRVLWPVVTQPSYDEQLGLRRGVVYLREFAAELSVGDLAGVAGLYLLFPVVAVALWLADGAPGPAALYRVIRDWPT